jgi:hypothetical protein
MESIQNLTININCIHDNCFTITIFNRNLEVVRDYKDAYKFINEFCEEHNIDQDTLIINEY